MLSPSKVSKDASCRSPRRPRKRLLSYEIQSDESQTKQQWSDGVSCTL